MDPTLLTLAKLGQCDKNSGILQDEMFHLVYFERVQGKDGVSKEY